MRMKVYLAGPMRGHPEFNFPAFLAAGEILERRFDVFNPAAMDVSRGFRFEGLSGFEDPAELGFGLRQAFAADMAFIANEADFVVVLPGWQASKGARAEVALAEAIGISVYEWEDVRAWSITERGRP